MVGEQGQYTGQGFDGLIHTAAGFVPFRQAERGEPTREGCAFDVKGRPVDIDEFVFIPLYDVALSAGHGAWADEIPPKSALAFRRDWLEAFVTSAG